MEKIIDVLSMVTWDQWVDIAQIIAALATAGTAIVAILDLKKENEDLKEANKLQRAFNQNNLKHILSKDGPHFIVKSTRSEAPLRKRITILFINQGGPCNDLDVSLISWINGSGEEVNKKRFSISVANKEPFLGSEESLTIRIDHNFQLHQITNNHTIKFKLLFKYGLFKESISQLVQYKAVKTEIFPPKIE